MFKNEIVRTAFGDNSPEIIKDLQAHDGVAAKWEREFRRELLRQFILAGVPMLAIAAVLTLIFISGGGAMRSLGNTLIDQFFNGTLFLAVAGGLVISRIIRRYEIPRWLFVVMALLLSVIGIYESFIAGAFLASNRVVLDQGVRA